MLHSHIFDHSECFVLWRPVRFLGTSRFICTFLSFPSVDQSWQGWETLGESSNFVLQSVRSHVQIRFYVLLSLDQSLGINAVLFAPLCSLFQKENFHLFLVSAFTYSVFLTYKLLRNRVLCYNTIFASLEIRCYLKD